MKHTNGNGAIEKGWLRQAWDFTFGNTRLHDRGMTRTTEPGHVLFLAVNAAISSGCFTAAAHHDPIKAAVAGFVGGLLLCVLASQAGTIRRSRIHDNGQAPTNHL